METEKVSTNVKLKDSSLYLCLIRKLTKDHNDFLLSVKLYDFNVILWMLWKRYRKSPPFSLKKYFCNLFEKYENA